MGVPGKTEGTIFSPIPVEIIYSENEKVGGKLQKAVFSDFYIAFCAIFCFSFYIYMREF